MPAVVIQNGHDATNGHSATNGIAKIKANGVTTNGAVEPPQHIEVIENKSEYGSINKPAVKLENQPPPRSYNFPVCDASPHVFDVDPTYALPEVPMGTRRKLKVIYIGGGMGGLNFSYQVQKWMRDLEHVCYEKNAKIAGTWLENKYPGCACDIPSHSYQFAWAPNSEWSEYYSGSDEIEAYANKIADDFDLRKYIKLNHTVVGAEWNETTSKWDVRIKKADGEVFIDSAHILINGGGVLNDWKWPDIPNREEFQGEMLHSAIWPKEATMKDKRVAVIGVGSTAVQIVPNIEPDVKSLKQFIRSRTWITPSIGGKYAGPGGQNFKYTPEQKKEFLDNPEMWMEYRKGIEHEVSSRYKYAMKDSEEQKTMIKLCTKIMEDKLAGRPHLAEKLIPDFTVGCRRPTPGNGYLESLCSDKVEAIFSPIKEFTEKGILTADGVEHEFDTIICATGFNASFLPRFPLIGRKGIDLRDQWTDIAESYLGLTIPNFPNYMLTLGPSSPAAHGSILPLLELISRYQLKFIHKMQVEPAMASFEPKASLMKEFQTHRIVQLAKTTWSTHCATWFKNHSKPNGTIVALHPGSRTHYFQTLDQPRFEDYEYEYKANRFTYMGNGFTLRETEEKDLCYYLDEEVWDAPFLYSYDGITRPNTFKTSNGQPSA